MRTLTLLLLLSGIMPAFGKEKPQIGAEPLWRYAINPDVAKKPDLKQISNGYFLELYDGQINLPKQTRYTHFIRKIVNESGIQNASEISVQFAPEYESLTFHYIRIIRNGAILNQLKLKEIKVIQEEDDIDQYQYNGLKRAIIILKDVRKEDRIEAAYSLTGFNPVFSNKFTEDIRFVFENPVLNYYQTIIAPVSSQLKFTYYGGATKPQELLENNHKIYHWNNPQIGLWESMSGSPSWFDPYPTVTVSEFSNWQDLVKWGLTIYNDYKFELPTNLTAKINQWRKLSNGDDDEFTRHALRFVQDDIRYLGLEIGENTHKPHPPAEVFTNGYGDCKDKALLLSAILREQGIPAYAALVNTSVRGELMNKAASPYEFDHVIVGIENAGSLQYVDPTISYQRGVLSNVFTPAYGYALLLKEGEIGLRAITHSKTTVVRSTEWVKVSFDDTSTFTANTSYGGEKADGIRSYFATTSLKDATDSYQKYYASLFDGIVMSKDIEYEDDSVTNMLRVKEAYHIPDIWVEDEDRKRSFSTYARLIDDIFPDPTGKPNTYPLSLSFPNEVHYTLKIEMPEPWSIDQEKVQIKNDSYEFNFDGSVSGSLITLKYSLITFKDHIPAKEISQFKKDYKKIASLVQFRFSFGGKNGNGDIKPVGGVNFLAILLGLLAAGGAFGLFNILNRRTIDVIIDRSEGYRLGGWVAILGITLIFGLAVQLYVLFDANYFSSGAYAAWQTYGEGFVFTVMAELFLYVFRLFATIAMIYWFVQRRDIFPSMFNGYVTMLIASQAILFMLYRQYATHETLGDLADEGLVQVGRYFLYGVVWCSFLARSNRAKWTFLREYKS